MLQSFAFTLPLLFALPVLASQLSDLPFGGGTNGGKLIKAFMWQDGMDILGLNGDFEYVKTVGQGGGLVDANDGTVVVQDNLLKLSTVLTSTNFTQDQTRIGIKTKESFDVPNQPIEVQFVASFDIVTSAENKAQINAAKEKGDADFFGYTVGIYDTTNGIFTGFEITFGQNFIRTVRESFGTESELVKSSVGGTTSVFEVVSEIPIPTSENDISVMEAPNSGLGIILLLGIVLNAKSNTMTLSIDNVTKGVNRGSGIIGGGEFIRRISELTLPLSQSTNASKSNLPAASFIAKKDIKLANSDTVAEPLPTKFYPGFSISSRNRNLGCIPERVSNNGQTGTFRCRKRPTPISFVGVQSPESPVNPEVGGDSSAQPATGDQKTTLNNLVAVDADSDWRIIMKILGIIIFQLSS